MRHSVEWHDEANNAAPEEQATVADLRLWLKDSLVTQHLNQGMSCDHVTVALFGLAHGLAHDWWTIFGARDNDVSLTKYRSGYLVPDIRFRFDGAAFEIEAKAQIYTGPDVRFWPGPTELVSRADGEAELRNFIEMVLHRMDDRSVRDTSAHLRRQRVKASQETDEALFCEAAGALKLDPYQIDNDAASFIESAEAVFEDQPLVDFVAGAACIRRQVLLEWVVGMLEERSPKFRVPELNDAVKEALGMASNAAHVSAWARGYRRARAMRRVLSLSQDRKFSSFRDIAKRLGAGNAYNLAPRVDGIRALRAVTANGTQIYLRNHGDSSEAQAQHLFAMARAVGDATCFPDDRVAPINDLRNAHRQAAGRAFAAEFLAPIEEIRSMLHDRHDLMTVANEFGVSTQVIEHQIDNAERIDAACA